MNATRTTLGDVLWRWPRGIARACRWRHDGAVIPGGKRGLSPVIYVRNLILAGLLLWASPAWAAFGSVGSFCTANNNTSSTSWAFTTTAQLSAGNLGVIVLSTDNLATTDGNSNTHTTITDAAGNTWTKAREFTNTVGGVAADGVTVSVWYSKASANLASGANVTVNLSGAIVAKAVTCWQFTMGAGNIVVDGGADRADDAVDAGSITLSGLQNVQHLWLRGTGAESVTTTYTASTNYTAFTHTSSTDNTGTNSTSMGARGEYRIFTGTSDSTDPTASGARDHASTMVALSETSTFEQSAYRAFNNANSTDVGTPLAAQNTAATLGSTGAAFRLRMLIHVGGVNLGISGQAFKLQFAARSGTCDTAFSGEAYADVTAASVIAYNNNSTPADGANLTANASDPTHGGDTVVNQTYEELNNFTNPAAINSGRDGKWDFSLIDNGATPGTTYCFRVVKDTGTVLDTYTVIPEITTASTTFNQSAYRLFDNANSTDVGAALAALNTAATLGSTGATFRLRMLIHVGVVNLGISGQAFKLQFAARSGTCDTAFSGETYADVTAASVIAYNNNSTPADGANLTANANDPTHGGDTVVNQDYEELNNFTNSVAAINAGRDGKWDFALVDNGAPASTAYCFRVVDSTGALLDTYTVIPEITTAPRGTIFYFHDATTPDIGTLPAATTMSATTPDVTAAGAGTNRDMDQTIGTAQVSAALTTNASTSLRRNWFRRFLSRPLAAQTLPTGVWTIQGGASESSGNSNMLPWGVVIKVWRPSTGTTVATLLDNPTLGIAANEPGTTETNVSQLTASITGVAVNDGDILVIELWAENTQSSSSNYTNTIFYDGTTEGSTSSNAAFLQAPGAISFYRSLRQSAYRLFNNADSTDVGTALAGQDTAATLPSTGAAFRLRMLLHVADINLGISGQAFKLQFAARSGTCDTAFSGEAYADVTAASVIAYNNNATPADGANLTNNANDPTHGGDTRVNQTYEELNNFTNSAAAINSGQDGKWDFALKDNGAPASTAYCFRVVKDTGTVLDIYTVIPEITTAAGVPTPGSFNAFETSTAAGAITGVIRTKVAGSAFSLDVVAIAAGVQQAGFTDAVIVELRGNNTLGVSLDAQNCPTSSTLVQTVSPNPTITGGRSTVNFAAVAESWRDVRVRVRWPAASPTVTWCSTDNFAIRPNTLASFAVTDTDWQTTGTPGARALNLLTFAATTPIHKAGRPFSVRATAVNAVAATTTNYVGAPTATLSTCGSAACTATFGTLTLTTTFVAGQLASDVASYNDVGSFWLQLVDSTFASVDAADTTGDCTGSGRYVCSATINVGRFVPDHLAVSLNTPVFGTDCGSFTYIGRAFNYTTPPVITVTGQDFSNNPTALYTGTWFRISNSSLTGKSYTWATGTLDTSGITGTDPVINSAARTLTFSSGTGVLFTRTTPVAPFDAEISLAINVIDDDTVAYATNPARFGTASAGNGISFSAGKPMRFGRLAIRNANGSQLVPLPVQVEAQYWSGAPTNAFITNTQDSCTSIAAANDAMGNYTGNLSGSPTCETAISGGGTLSAGRKTLQLAAPGSGNNGSVDLTVNLGASASGNTCTTLGGAPGSATTANLPHLQGNWTGGAYNVNPSARATFGVFKGAEEVIFVRENF